MKHILKNLVPYWKAVILIVLLMAVQAYCDLAMPQYTSDIIDVGIMNKGIEHITPEQITEDEFTQAMIFMNEDEQKLWESLYEEQGDVYGRKDTDEEVLDQADEKLLGTVVLTYQLGHMEESKFRETVKEIMSQNPMAAAYADMVDDMSIEEIEKNLQIDVDTFQAENEEGVMSTYVDMRRFTQTMIESGAMTDDMIKQSRNAMEKMTEAMGTQTLMAMGKNYAADCDAKAGMDMNKVQTKYLWHEGRLMLLMALVMLLGAIGVSYLASRIGAGIGRTLREKIFKRVISFGNTEIEKFSTASLITRNTNDVQQIQMVTAMMLRMVLYAPVVGIGGVYKVAKTGAGMGWIIGLAVLVILGFVMVLMAIAMPKFKKMQTLVDNVNLVSREILTGLSVIRAFGREKKEEERFDAANTELKKTQLFTSRTMTFMMPGMMLIMNLLVLLVMWVSAKRIDAGTLQVGTMTAFITYSMIIVISFLMLTMLSIILPRAGVAADRIHEVLTTETSITDKKETEALENTEGVISFEKVCFRYPDAKEDVLHNISFTAKPGEVTAIIGSTGAGKSTLINLIPRFYDVTEGKITLDGIDIRDLSLKTLRDKIGLVPQKAILFSGTIDSNLRFGKEDASSEEIQRAAEIAQAEDFVMEKDEKYDSAIAQGGSNVSGGQKQRLSIARAIAKNPKVYIFDDSFSALDMKTDAKLRKALEKNIENATQIIVAQRISTILHADQIIVLDDGEIVGIGTHSELIRNCDVYGQIARSQLSEKEIKASLEGEVN